MSDALSYLVKVRPEAMTSYFKFLKQSGEHLDTRTRDLISVIAKVDSQTDAGLRQYLTRALRNGATPDEVIDALLTAFPILGLSKITWAAEVLVDMDLPEFRPENLGAQPEWHEVAPLEAIPEDEVSYQEADGRHLFVYRSGDTLRIYDSRCPHQVTDIPRLALENGVITCPKHNWQFDAATGECIAVGKHPMRQFEHKVEQGRVLAWW